MKNLIKYYYDLEIDSITYSYGEYRFKYHFFDYSLINIERDVNEINDIYIICNELHRLNIPCHEIIKNNLNLLVTTVEQKKYILLKKYVISNQPITIEDVLIFNFNTTYNWNYDSLKRTSWYELWIKKIDNYEYQMGQIGKKYPLLYQSLYYFIGVTESGLQLINMIHPLGKLSICHKRIYKSMSLSEFYNPLNFVIDYRVRDISEYCKQNILNLSEYLYIKIFNYITMYFDKNDIILFLIRNLLPTFYFDLYEKITIETLNEDVIIDVINNIDMYEKFLKKIYVFTKTYINIPKIEWLDN